MPVKIVRKDITKMQTDVIVNVVDNCTKNVCTTEACDGNIFVANLDDVKTCIANSNNYLLYQAAGYEEVLTYSEEKGNFTIGEERLRACFQRSFQIATDNHVKSIAFPLISTKESDGSKEEGLRIAMDEINAFLQKANLLVYLVVPDGEADGDGRKRYRDLERYISFNYVEAPSYVEASSYVEAPSFFCLANKMLSDYSEPADKKVLSGNIGLIGNSLCRNETDDFSFERRHESKLEERMHHLSDTFSQYLMYLIQNKQMENAEVWRRAIVDKKIFSKIKNNPNYHPQKLTALCLCIGAKLNLDETKDLLARAGYALSPCDKTDIIFSYFIENEIYDMIELDIQLEEHGLPCIIS